MLLAIYGAGGNGRTILDNERNRSNQHSLWDEIVFIDDTIGVDSVNDAKVYTFEQFCSKYQPCDPVRLVVSLGEPGLRKVIYNRILEKGYELATLIADDANVSPYAKLGKGVIVASNVIISANCKIDDNSIIFFNTLVGHDTIIGKHCLVGFNVFMGGKSEIKDEVYIGSQSSIKDRIHIGEQSVIAMASAIYKDIPAFSTAMGNPARCITRSKDDQLFGN